MCIGSDRQLLGSQEACLLPVIDLADILTAAFKAACTDVSFQSCPTGTGALHLPMGQLWNKISVQAALSHWQRCTALVRKPAPSQQSNTSQRRKGSLSQAESKACGRRPASSVLVAAPTGLWLAYRCSDSSRHGLSLQAHVAMLKPSCDWCHKFCNISKQGNLPEPTGFGVMPKRRLRSGIGTHSEGALKCTVVVPHTGGQAAEIPPAEAEPVKACS